MLCLPLRHLTGTYNCTHHFVGSDLPELVEHLLQLVIGQIVSEVLDVNIGELLGLLSQLLLPLLAGDKSSDEDFLLVEQHAIYFLDSVHRSFLGLEVHKSISLKYKDNERLVLFYMLQLHGFERS